MPVKQASVLVAVGAKVPPVIDKQKEAAEKAAAAKKAQEEAAARAAKKARENRIKKACRQVKIDLAHAFPGVNVEVEALTKYGPPISQNHEEGFGFFRVSDLLLFRARPRGKQQLPQYSLHGYAPTESREWDTHEIQWRMSEFRLGPRGKVDLSAVRRVIASAPEGTIFDCETAIARQKRDASRSAIRDIERDRAHQ